MKKQLKKMLQKIGFQTTNDIKKHNKETNTDKEIEAMLRNLEKKYDGSNGLPKFNRKKVLKFCLDNRILDPEVGYRMMVYLGPNYHPHKKTRKERIQELEDQLYDLQEQMDIVQDELRELNNDYED